MTDHLEAYLREPAPGVAADYLTLQRHALAEIIKLSADSVAPAVHQIESLYSKAKHKVEHQLAQSRQEIETRFEQQREAIQQDCDRRTAEIQAAADAERDALKEDTRARQNTVNLGAEGQILQVKKKCEEDILFAETDRDAVIQKSLQERRHIEKAVPAGRQRLQEMREQAEQILEVYRHPRPEEPEEELGDLADTENAQAEFRQQLKNARRYLDILQYLRIPRLFIGTRPLAYAFMLCGIGAGTMWFVQKLPFVTMPSFMITGPMAVAVTLAVTLWIGHYLAKKGHAQIDAVYEPFQRSVAAALKALDLCLAQTLQQVENQIQTAKQTYQEEVARAKDHFQSAKSEVDARSGPALQGLEEKHSQALAALEAHLNEDLQHSQQEYQAQQNALEGEHEQALLELQQLQDKELAESRRQYESDRRRLEARWQEGLACIETLLRRSGSLEAHLDKDWDDPCWHGWEPSMAACLLVRFGSLQPDLDGLAAPVRQLMAQRSDAAGRIRIPALLTFANPCSLLLETDRTGRDQAIGTLRAVMLRLLTCQPPGRVHFTIIDPVGLGENFAGFMHAADYQETLVGRRIWTDAGQIQQRLVDLTEHMENVIQKYLRNEFETIEQYNVQAGELAEPYRFLVIADFPVNWNEESVRRLGSIVNSGARCGVYTLIAFDARQEAPAGIDMADIASHSVHLVFREGRFIWQDEIYRRFPLETDRPASEAMLTDLMHKVGRAATDTSRVEVPFAIVAPPDEGFWSGDSRQEVRVPIGRSGANRMQYLTLGRGVAQHTLIAGKTGSGKSTLLHVIITNLSLWYAPDQVELYLIDFKRGVEFKTYVTHALAHARVVAIESDREFGLSILQRLDAEMARRGELFRRAGVQDVASYRQVSGKKLPRTILIVDEFQVFFSEDDKLAQEASVLLEQLVRQGRAFGVHVLLGSQTLGGASGLARSTMGQMAVRIALQCSEADSQLILDDDNVAARLLNRPGEAIYNDTSGMIIGNSPFQTAWLPDDQRDQYLDRIGRRADGRTRRPEPMIVFEGNVPADLAANTRLAERLAGSDWPEPAAAGLIWLGEPMAIKEPTCVVFRRQSGAHLLIIGQREELAAGFFCAALLALATQYRPNAVRFYILDGTPADSAQAGYLPRVAGALPHDSRIVEWRQVTEVVSELTAEMQRRLEEDRHDEPAVYVLIYGLQRYRMLRRTEDDFAFSLEADADAPAQPAAQFAELLRDGPTVGIHVMVWTDTLATFERTWDRQAMREFDNRILFQMSAADSSHLIDSPVANKLGYYRALLFSEERGILEQFRPYAPAGADWLAQVKKQLARKSP